MGVVLFFSLAFFIFLAGVIVLSLTFYNWYKQARTRKQQKTSP